MLASKLAVSVPLLPQVVISLLLNMLLLGGSVVWWSAGGSGPAGVLLRASSSGSSSGQAPRNPSSAPEAAALYGSCERAQLNESLLQDWGCKVFEKACFDQVRLQPPRAAAHAAAAASRCPPPLCLSFCLLPLTLRLLSPSLPATTTACRRALPADASCLPLPACLPACLQGHMILHSGLKTPDHPNFTAEPVFTVHSVPAYVLPGYPEPLVGGVASFAAQMCGGKGQPAGGSQQPAGGSSQMAG
jgi:hypothetical protein